MMRSVDLSGCGCVALIIVAFLVFGGVVKASAAAFDWVFG